MTLLGERIDPLSNATLRAMSAQDDLARQRADLAEAQRLAEVAQQEQAAYEERERIEAEFAMRQQRKQLMKNDAAMRVAVALVLAEGGDLERPTEWMGHGRMCTWETPRGQVVYDGSTSQVTVVGEARAYVVNTLTVHCVPPFDVYAGGIACTTDPMVIPMRAIALAAWVRPDLLRREREEGADWVAVEQ